MACEGTVMRVFRIEDDNSEGPYNGATKIPGLGARHTDREHPCPWDDGISTECDDYFGFASLLDMARWFNSMERHELTEHGFSLAVYEAARVKAGKRQVAFYMPTAELVSRQPISLGRIQS